MVSIQKKKVVILGAGAVGLLYGSRLLEAEQNKGSLIDVHFICRRDFDYIKTNGFHMKSPDGDYASSNLSVNKKIHCDSSTIDVPPTGVDWIIICVKCYSFQGADGVLLKAMIETMVGSNTRFLLIMNGLGCEKYLCDWFGAAKCFVGMAFTCVNRNNPKNKIDTDIPFILVDHIAFGALHIAHCQDNPIELEIAKSLWIGTKIEEKVTTGLSLLYAQWSKLCWNIPFSGLCVALGGITTDIIANDAHLRSLADKIMTDTITLANEDILWHRNMHPKEEYETAVKIFDMEETKAFCWNLTDKMGPYKPSTLLDLIKGNDLELEYMFNQPLLRAQELSNLHEKSSESGNEIQIKTDRVCKWSYLETIVMQVNGIANIAKQKKMRDVVWIPTYLS